MCSREKRGPDFMRAWASRDNKAALESAALLFLAPQIAETYCSATTVTVMVAIASA